MAKHRKITSHTQASKECKKCGGVVYKVPSDEFDSKGHPIMQWACSCCYDKHPIRKYTKKKTQKQKDIQKNFNDILKGLK